MKIRRPNSPKGSLNQSLIIFPYRTVLYSSATVATICLGRYWYFLQDNKLSSLAYKEYEGRTRYSLRNAKGKPLSTQSEQQKDSKAE